MSVKQFKIVGYIWGPFDEWWLDYAFSEHYPDSPDWEKFFKFIADNGKTKVELTIKVIEENESRT